MLLLLLAACPAEETPPETCDPVGTAAWSGGTAFVENTSAWGLDGVTGGLISSADLDGDGWPDLLVTEVFGEDTIDDPDAGVYYHRLLLNRDNGSGGRTFTDATVDSGILANRNGGVGQPGADLVMGDVDNDGDVDIYSGRYRSESGADTLGLYSELYLNDGSAHFTIKEDAGVWSTDPYPTMGAAFTDYDVDGDLDLFVSGWYKDYGISNDAADPILYRGGGDGTFTDVSEAALPKLKSSASTTNAIERDRRRPAMGNTVCDVNGDTLPDLIQSNYGRSWNFLFLNLGDGTFDEVGEETTVDADDNLDYSDNWYYVCYCEETGDCPLAPSIDCPDSSLSSGWYPGFDDTESRLAGNTFTTVCGDVDNDGDMDLFETDIAHDWAGQSSDPSQLLLNDGSGSFVRQDNDTNGLARHRNKSSWNEGDIWGAFADFDNDGWSDIFIVSTDYPNTEMHLFRQTAPAVFEEVSDDTGMNQDWPYGITAVDFDGDGDLDIITGSSTARSGTPWEDHRLHFYENQLGGNFVRLSGLPIGTRVEVSAGGVTQTQEVQGGFGRGSIQNDLSLHFGLGDVCMIDSVRATKPGGEAKEWTDLAGNQTRDLSF